MGYFDYLEQSRSEKLEFQAFDVYAKTAFWIGVGALGVLIVSCFIYGFGITLGENLYLGIINVLSLSSAVVGMVFAIKALKIAKSKRKSSPLSHFSLAYNTLWVLINAAIILANTWVYFS